MNSMMKRLVVVGIDGSASALQAVRWAADDAALRHTQLMILHVWTPVPVAVPHAASLPPYEGMLVEQGHKWLAEARTAAQDTAPDVTTTTRLAAGTAAGQLIGQSASAELVVLGSRGLGGFAELLAGSIAVAVSTHGHCPVVVVRGADPQDTSRQNGPVVLGVDGSSASRAAIPFAFEAASLRNAPLIAVHAWSDLPVTNAWELTTAWDGVERRQSQVLSEWLAESQGRYPGVHVQQLVVQDRPAHVLIDHTTRAQLVVVGSRGRGGFRGLLLGSTSQALIHHAACPVAVVPRR